MIEKLIQFFATRHLLTNLLTLAVYISGIFFWMNTPRQELPDIDFNYVRITTVYPGASPEEVEHFVTRPLEDELKGVNGIYRLTSTSSNSSSSIGIEIEDSVDDLSEAVNDIRTAVYAVNLPVEILDKPVIRQFKTSQKAIMDIAMYNRNRHLLDDATRRDLQAHALTLENRLTSLSSISSVSINGYLKEEVHILARPDLLANYNIPFTELASVITSSSIRTPAGTLEKRGEPRITVLDELDSAQKLRPLIIRGGFEGQEVRLSNLATVKDTFEKNRTILKVNGSEAVVLNAVKTPSSGILRTVDEANKSIKEFKASLPSGSPIEIVVLDDESRTVRSRLSLIGWNGAIGFVLIFSTLLIFLNMRAAFWVALGIPFSFCFAMTVANFLGYSINNITLAGIIIVMGMVVDDAIVVAENITRLRDNGYDHDDAAIEGTKEMFLPITAAIITTCVAFLPILGFSGRFAKMSMFIPVMVMLMLGGSLLESLLILPAHLNLIIPEWVKGLLTLGVYPLTKRLRKGLFSGGRRGKPDEEFPHWFHAVEERYSRILERLLRYRFFIYGSFILMLVLAGILFETHMKFVMFPREETTEFTITAETSPESDRYDTAKASLKIEKVLSRYLGKEIIGFRSLIAQSRGGMTAQENTFRIRIEVPPREEREMPLPKLKALWKKEIEKIPGIYKVRYRRAHFGQASGSPIEILVQENNNPRRRLLTDTLAEKMRKHPDLQNVEIERPVTSPEYLISVNRNKASRLGIKASSVAATLRSILEGKVLYIVMNENEEINIRLLADKRSRRSLDRVLQIPVENTSSYMVPLREVVTVIKTDAPSSISRYRYRRTTSIYADIKEKSKTSPLEVAEYFETTVFPELLKKNPTSHVSFEGEVRDTRESAGDFRAGIIIVLFLIYTILALLFNSLLQPFIIMISIPFGIVGVIFAFLAHGMTFFGIFAGIGTLGLAGVVVNDSIIMVNKLQSELDPDAHWTTLPRHIAGIASTRLRAVMLTTITTVAGLLPTAYGFAGYDAMLAEMMLAMAWGLVFGTLITLVLVPTLYMSVKKIEYMVKPAGERG